MTPLEQEPTGVVKEGKEEKEDKEEKEQKHGVEGEAEKEDGKDEEIRLMVGRAGAGEAEKKQGDLNGS